MESNMRQARMVSIAAFLLFATPGAYGADLGPPLAVVSHSQDCLVTQLNVLNERMGRIIYNATQFSETYSVRDFFLAANTCNNGHYAVYDGERTKRALEALEVENKLLRDDVNKLLLKVQELTPPSR
jgi:hypothetical protein